MVSLGLHVLAFRQICSEISSRATHMPAAKCSQGICSSCDRGFVPICVGVPWRGSVTQENDASLFVSTLLDFSLYSLYIIVLQMALLSKFTTSMFVIGSGQRMTDGMNSKRATTTKCIATALVSQLCSASCCYCIAETALCSNVE